ncbi:hypothetical protein B9Z55_027844 [Caenorhabditis nigoni]|uniref:Uncharacterized protein n=1 Tax=Caenorhabditis nigoni TaxID=1611254 RepID=A0A2G5SE23_9PELO|nr:hypothetical protein B9Z55_027844 [Caenorhabditis nigoni]
MHHQPPNRERAFNLSVLMVSGPARNLDPTTSFLTAAITRYTRRAGITAAAGTRLALSLLLEESFVFNSLK